jgi:hypothetical protein
VYHGERQAWGWCGQVSGARHRRGDVYDAMRGARDARRALWLRQQGTKAWLERTIAVLRVRNGMDQWESEGGAVRGGVE